MLYVKLWSWGHGVHGHNVFREDDGGSEPVGVETLIDVLAGHNDFGELHRVPARFPLYLFPVLETVCVVIERKQAP